MYFTVYIAAGQKIRINQVGRLQVMEGLLTDMESPGKVQLYIRTGISLSFLTGLEL